MKKRAVHFVGFRGEEYHSAVRVWGKPDFFHRNWDVRVKHGGEYDKDNDVVVFAKGDENSRLHEHAFNDSAVF